MFTTPSLPNTLRPVTPAYWVEQCQRLYEVLPDRPTTPKEIRTLVQKGKTDLNLKWLSDYLRFGVGLGFITKMARGIYQRNPCYAFMLKPPHDMTEGEHVRMVEIITQIPQCQLILKATDYQDVIQRVAVMQCLRDKETPGFDQPSLDTALVLLCYYGFLIKTTFHNTKNQRQVAYRKIIEYPKALIDETVRENYLRDFTTFLEGETQ